MFIANAIPSVALARTLHITIEYAARRQDPDFGGDIYVLEVSTGTVSPKEASFCPKKFFLHIKV